MQEKLEQAISDFLLDVENQIYHERAISPCVKTMESEKLQGMISDYHMYVLDDPDMSGGHVAICWVEKNELYSWVFEFRRS